MLRQVRRLGQVFLVHPFDPIARGAVGDLAIAALRLPIAEYPDIAPPSVQVTALYPGGLSSGNNFYDRGEGIAGLDVHVSDADFYCKTAVGGGWAVRANEIGRWLALGLLALFGLALIFPAISDRMTRPPSIDGGLFFSSPQVIHGPGSVSG